MSDTMHPEKMEKLLVVGESSLLPSVINKLHKLKVLHIIEHKKNEELDIGKPFQDAEKISELLIKIRALISQLDIKTVQELQQKRQTKTKKDKDKLLKNTNLKSLAKEMDALTTQVNSLLEKQKNLDSKIKANQQDLNQLSILQALKLELELLTNYDSIAYFIGYVQNIDLLKTFLQSSKLNYELKTADTSGKHTIALFVEKTNSQKALEMLSKTQFTAIDFSKYMGSTQLIARLKKELEQLERQIVSSEKQLHSLKIDNQEHLLIAERILSTEIKKAEIPLKFGSTDNAFFITGYVPRSMVAQVTEVLQKEADNTLFIQKEDLHHDEHVPVLLHNKKTVEPFQFFLDLYSLPSYHEIDPSIFLFMAFPILFGFMLGDFGYGLVTLALFYFLKNKIKAEAAQQLFKILIWASLWTLVFGLFFGEFFGYEELAGFHIPHVIGREQQKMLLLTVAIGIGVLHVNIGLIIGFLNELHHHGLWHAFCAKISWILLQIGVALLYMSYSMYLIPPIFGFVLLGIASILLYLGEGIRGLVELPSIFGNILSYARLMALGLASVGLAVVVNEMAAEFFHEPTFINILVGVLILVIGHMINIALGILGPFLHSLRLQYVEFFTKFYSGGGTAYKPFGEDEK